MGKSDLKVKVINEITKPRGRDKQWRVGPSQLGDPCPRCTGRALAATGNDVEPQEFSLYPWQGTAVHYYLEDHVFPEAEHELKLLVGSVRGYGDIRGTTDIYWPDEKIVGDWKLVGKKKIQEYRIKGPKEQYRYQIQLYARGCELSGRPVDSVAIVHIPRDSGNVNDIWIHQEDYQPEMAEAVLERASRIYDIVLTKGWESLPSDEDCWSCNREFYL